MNGFINRFFLKCRTLSFCFVSLLLISISANAQIDVIADDKLIIEKESERISTRYYTTHSLHTKHESITKLVIVLHGNNRNADDYFDNMQFALAQRPNEVPITAIVAPQYLTEDDLIAHRLSSDHAYWSSDGWKSGSNSKDDDSNPRNFRIPSFEVQDTLIMRAVKSYPNLTQLVFTGHSAGGQFTNRYTAASPIFELLCSDYNISSKSIIANPGTYVYMSPERRVDDSEIEFAIPNIDCPDYNEWSFGLEDLFIYPTQAGADKIKEWYSTREVVYLLGQDDNDPNATTLPRSCRAMTFGNHRYERGRIYYNHIVKTFGEEIKLLHSKVEVPDVAHNNLHMYASEEGLRVLFDEEPIGDCRRTTATTDLVEEAFTIFPIPAHSYISINTDFKKIKSVSIINFYGKTIIKQNEKTNLKHIDISSLPTGVFLVRLETEQGLGISKFIKV